MSKRHMVSAFETAREMIAIIATTALLVVGTAAIVSVSVAAAAS